jgi:peptidyl-prolyl cis-trans isomerase SurA
MRGERQKKTPGQNRGDAMGNRMEPMSRRAIMTAIVVATILLGWPPAPAFAQQVVAVVNGDPITAVDITQRTKLVQLSTHRPAARQEILDELIDEKLKLQIAKRFKLEITDSEIEGTFKTIASRSGNSSESFGQALIAQGISPEHVKIRIRADMGWQQIIRGKFQSNFQFRERDILDSLASGRKEGEAAVGYEYTLRPILLIIPRGSAEPVVAARKREAEGLRTRFQGCEEGLRLARGLKDIAVRDAVLRTSADLGPQLREILDSTQEGRLTAPEMTQQGIEMYALCGKRQTTSELPGKREVRERMFQEKFTDQGKRYLKELRSGAMIEYR